MTSIAILAAAAVPIYNSFTSRAYGTEVQTALSTLRTAQRTYKAAHGDYAPNLWESDGSPSLEGSGYVSQSDFADMKYVNATDLSVSADNTSLATWAGNIDGYQYTSVTMNASGALDKTE